MIILLVKSFNKIVTLALVISFSLIYPPIIFIIELDFVKILVLSEVIQKGFFIIKIYL